MENRNSLELHGWLRGRKEFLKIKGSAVVYIDRSEATHVIPIANIQKVSIGPPRFYHNGCLTIATAQTHNNGGFTTIPAGNSFVTIPLYSNPDLTLFFLSTDELPYAENIQKYILDFQANAASGAAPCELDQIAKLKDLLDAGAITEEEFEAKKKQLLGL